jgi:hypothetical protein
MALNLSMDAIRYNPKTLGAFTLVALVVCSIPVFGTPFLNDMQFYALVADKLLVGPPTFHVMLDTKPPLVFWHYALVFKLFGLNNVTAVKVVTMGWLGLSALLLVAIRKALSPALSCPTLVALVFVLASFSGWGEEYLSSNSEILANLFILSGVWFLISKDFKGHPLRLLAGGACIGIACLYRYQSGAAIVAYATTLAYCRRQLKHSLSRLAWVAVGAALPGLLLVGHYARVGALADFQLLLSYQRHYGQSAHAFDVGATIRQLLLGLCGLIPLLLLTTWQAVTIVRNRAKASLGDVFQLMFVVFSVVTFFVGGRYAHYFLQSIPALALLATERLTKTQTTGSGVQAWIEAHALTILIVVAAAFTTINGIYYWTRKEPSKGLAIQTFIEVNSRPNDEVLLWVWRPELLLQTGRLFATRLLVNSPLLGQLDRSPGAALRLTRRDGLAELWPAFLSDLRSAPPRLIIDDPPGRSEWALERLPQLASFLAGYRPCKVIDDLCVYLRLD